MKAKWQKYIKRKQQELATYRKHGTEKLKNKMIGGHITYMKIGNMEGVVVILDKINFKRKNM